MSGDPFPSRLFALPKRSAVVPRRSPSFPWVPLPLPATGEQTFVACSTWQVKAGGAVLAKDHIKITSTSQDVHMSPVAPLRAFGELVRFRTVEWSHESSSSLDGPSRPRVGVGLDRQRTAGATDGPSDHPVPDLGRHLATGAHQSQPEPAFTLSRLLPAATLRLRTVLVLRFCVPIRPYDVPLRPYDVPFRPPEWSEWVAGIPGPGCGSSDFDEVDADDAVGGPQPGQGIISEALVHREHHECRAGGR